VCKGLLKTTTSDKQTHSSVSVLVVFITPFLYGMERAVIGTFDVLRPDIDPHFVQSNRIFEREPPVIHEMLRHCFCVSLLPDNEDWEPLGRPRSLRHLWGMLYALVRSNIAVLKATKAKDVLFVPSARAGLLSVCAAVMCRATGRRVVHQFHDLGQPILGAQLWFRLVTDCIHNSSFGLRVAQETLPAIRGKRNIVLPYIVKIESEIREEVEAKRILCRTRNIFFVGQVSRHKGVDLLVRAFEPIARNHVDVTLHLLGGYNEDFRHELDEQIAAAGLIDRVRFWGYREDVLDLLRFAYLHVQSSPPSRFNECFPRSVLEAMAVGVPTICFQSGALPEMVLHERTGLICEESVSSLSDALNRFLVDKDFRDQCATRAKQRYEELFSPHRMRQSWIQFLAKGN
jgi:glycosyltransferase involved in cell wall biosynthesis